MENQEQKNNGMELTTQKNFNMLDPQQFDTMQRLCKLYAKSEIVPDMYRESNKNPLDKAMANSLIALEMAFRIGASPLMVMHLVMLSSRVLVITLKVVSAELIRVGLLVMMNLFFLFGAVI